MATTGEQILSPQRDKDGHHTGTRMANAGQNMATTKGKDGHCMTDKDGLCRGKMWSTVLECMGAWFSAIPHCSRNMGHWIGYCARAVDKLCGVQGYLGHSPSSKDVSAFILG